MTETDFIEFRDFCFRQHDVECNQKYDKQSEKPKPYSFHLKMVVDNVIAFENLLSVEDYYLALKGGAGHDLIEDARISYNEIKDMVGVEVAEIIFLCTEDKGRNRLARKSDAFYNELKQNRLAVFVKLCDIIANSTYSKITRSSMFSKYKNEWETKVREHLYRDEFLPMITHLDKLYNT